MLLTTNDAPSLGVTRTKMTLREALEAIADLPRDKWQRAGIGLHKPILMMLNGRPVAQGYLSGYAARQLAGISDVPSDDVSLGDDAPEY